MITLITEQAQQIEEALEFAIRFVDVHHNTRWIGGEQCLASIRAARAQEKREPTKDEYLELAQGADIIVAHEHCHLNEKDMKNAWVVEYGSQVYARAWLDGLDSAQPVKQEPVISEVFRICDAYESGFGHGAKNDGLSDGSIFADKRQGEAYELGYAEGVKRSKREQAEQEPVALIEECRMALAQELLAYDTDPPIYHVKKAHDKCVAWLSNRIAPQPSVRVAPTKTRNN